MPRNVTVTFSDGSQVQYNNVPDNVTPDQVQQRAMSETSKTVVSIDGGRSQAAPEKAIQEQVQPMGTVDTGDINSGFLMGLKDPISAGAQMLPRGLEYLSSLGGYSPNIVSKFFGDEAARVDAMIKAEEEKYQQGRQQRGEEGLDLSRIAGNVINPVNLAAGAGAARVLGAAPKIAQVAGTGAAAGVLQPVLNTEEGFAAEKARQAGLGAVGGVVGQKAVAGLGRVASPLVSKAEQTMRELGVTLTPGQLLGKQTKAIEEFAQNVPLIGKFISNAKERQLFQFNQGVINKALRKIDEKLPDDVIGRDAIEYVNDVVSKKYDDVLSNVSMQYDRQLAGKIGDVIRTSKIPGAANKQQLSDLLDEIVYSQIPVNKSVQGTVTGDMFKTIEANFNKNITQYSRSTNPNDLKIAEALKEALKIWRAELASQNPKQAMKLAKINAAYGDIDVMRTAAANSGAVNGVFTPKQYQVAVRQRDVTRGKRAYAAGRAKGQEVSDAAVEMLAPEAGSTLEGRLALATAGGYAALQNPAVATAALISTPLLYSKGGLKALEMIATRRPEIAKKIGDELGKRATKEGSITGAQVLEEYQRMASRGDEIPTFNVFGHSGTQ